MQVWIQSVEARKDSVQSILKRIDANVYVDKELKGCFNSFRHMLLNCYSGNEHIVHLQDDIMPLEGLQGYLPRVISEMETKGISVLSLFAPKRKSITMHYKVMMAEGIKTAIIPFPNFLWMQAVIFSPKTIMGLVNFLNRSSQTKYDDVFVAEYLKSTKQEAYVHIPSLVQHNINMKSTLGHRASKNRMSNCYQNDFLK